MVWYLVQEMYMYSSFGGGSGGLGIPIPSEDYAGRPHTTRLSYFLSVLSFIFNWERLRIDEGTESGADFIGGRKSE